MGREVEVLIEDHHRAWAGLLGTTENYLKVLVQGAGGKPGEHRGKIIRARIISSGTEGDDACRADFMAFLA
jgi:hypothetical protein